MKLEMSHREAAPGKIVITLAGRLMLGAESAAFEQLVGKLLNDGNKTIVVDLAGVTHIDSTGIGYCIASLNRTMQSAGQFRMANAGGQVREAFRVTRLDRIFQFFDDIQKALAS